MYSVQWLPCNNPIFSLAMSQCMTVAVPCLGTGRQRHACLLIEWFAKQAKSPQGWAPLRVREPSSDWYLTVPIKYRHKVEIMSIGGKLHLFVQYVVHTPCYHLRVHCQIFIVPNCGVQYTYVHIFPCVSLRANSIKISTEYALQCTKKVPHLAMRAWT